MTRVPHRSCRAFTILLVTLLLNAGSVGAAIVLQLGQNFTASTLGTDSQALPPDGAVAAGINHVVEFINGRYSVFNKAEGAQVQTMSDLAFWANAGVTIPTSLNVTDPRILFDSLSQRWFASMVDFNSSNPINNRFLLAISASADPTGLWRAVAFAADPVNGNFADFPTMGIDANGVYLSGDMFDLVGNSLGPSLVSIPKSGLLADPPSATGRTMFGILNAANYGSILQPAVTLDATSGPELVLAMGDLGYDFQPHSNLMSVAVQGSALETASLTGLLSLAVPAYSIPINPTQPSGQQNLDDGDGRFSATVYRVGEVLYAVHGTEVNGRAAIQWFEIDAATRTVLGTGLIADPVLELFYPSIAANAAGTVVIACNGCSSSSFVSCYATVGEKLNGVRTFGDLQLLKAGSASYRNNDSTGISRWGDYSAVCVDPVDSARFWAITMYPPGRTLWSTQITELIAIQVRLEIQLAAGDVVLSWPAAATNFQLQSTSGLSSANWTSVGVAPVLIDNQFRVALPATGSTAFFRLVK